MSPFEAIMLICFGISWPLSVIKSIRTKKVDGKSPLFMAAVGIGYISGMVHKFLFSKDLIIFIYIFNFLLVSLDIILYFKYRTKSVKVS